jgi:hypothetical protein
MAITIDYNFCKIDIKNTSNFPKGYADIEMDQLSLEKAL